MSTQRIFEASVEALAAQDADLGLAHIEMDDAEASSNRHDEEYRPGLRPELPSSQNFAPQVVRPAAPDAAHASAKSRSADRPSTSCRAGLAI
jgi:hypothetical protein